MNIPIGSIVKIYPNNIGELDATLGTPKQKIKAIYGKCIGNAEKPILTQITEPPFEKIDFFLAEYKTELID